MVNSANESINKLKFEGIKIGRRIKAYDFNPALTKPEEHYLEGVIINITSEHGYKAYVIEIHKDSVEKRSGEAIIPMEISMTEWDGRISIIE